MKRDLTDVPLKEVQKLKAHIRKLERNIKALKENLSELDEYAVDRAAQDLAVHEQCYHLWGTLSESIKEQWRCTVRLVLNSYNQHTQDKRQNTNDET